MILTLTTDDGEVIDEWNLDFGAFYAHEDWSRPPLSCVAWNLSSALAWAGLQTEIYESAHNRARYDRDERNKGEPPITIDMSKPMIEIPLREQDE